MTKLLAMIPDRKCLGELMILEDIFVGLDRDRWDIRVATLAAPRDVANVLFDGHRVPTAFFEQGTESWRASDFDERPDCVVFCNWQRDFAYDPVRVREWTELAAALGVPVALTDSTNSARARMPGQPEVFSRIDVLLTPCVFNADIPPWPGIETVYRPADLDAIRRHAPAEVARLAFLGASSRPRICVAASGWADHVGRVPGPSVFRTVMQRLHARFGDLVEILVMGRDAGDLAGVPGSPVAVPGALGFSEASEVLATVDLLISFNISSQAAARARWFGSRVLFITSTRDDIAMYGFRDMITTPDGNPAAGWAVLVADELDALEHRVASLLEQGRVRLARDVPTGAERIAEWMATR
jgi:hypothetical protein